MNRGKKYRQARTLVDSTKSYPLPEAVHILREAKFAKFDETVEVHIRLGVDPRNSEQQVRGTVGLPHGTGKTVRVLVFAQGEPLQQAEKAGADFVGGAELAEKVRGGWLDFDAVISTPDMMREVGKLGKVLGPRGLMPSPRAGTVTPDVAKAIREYKAGKVEFRTKDEGGNIHAVVGKLSFDAAKLAENVTAFINYVISLKPAAVRGQYIKGIVISATMSPGVRIAI